MLNICLQSAKSMLLFTYGLPIIYRERGSLLSAGLFGDEYFAEKDS